jgi:hypothetical protein
MTSEERWSWKFTPCTADPLEELDPHVQDWIVSKYGMGSYL